MTFKVHLKRTFRLAWPVMMGQLGHVMVGLADSIMIGQVSTTALAAGALANSIFMVPMVFGIGMAMGLTTPVANADGEGNNTNAGRYLFHGLVVNLLTAVFIFFSVLGFSFLPATWARNRRWRVWLVPIYS
ncbi:MAG: MATE family efflux transporter [Owenweeksia sp.]|nr:MATE family efflux transporter [Owenweeksia sp.]